MSKHVHAELMMQYAQDAMETDKPWERWQSCSQINSSEGLWRDCISNPSWCKDYKYRRKPQTININGYEVPEPLREAPIEGTIVYYPNLYSLGLVNYNKFFDDSFYRRLLNLGLLHSTQEAAKKHDRALLSFTAKEESDDLF